MHILILSCNTGAGHNSAASAIREELEQHGDTYTCMDALRLESAEFSKLVCAVHALTYRYTPKLYGKGYEKEEIGTISWVGRLLTPAAQKLHSVLQAEAFDAVICVHVFAALIVTELRKLYDDRLPAFFVATDYTCSPYVTQCNMDGFFIPHPALTEEFLNSGISADKLIASGIPVHNAFQARQSQKVARATLGLPESGKIILLASGSIGCGPLTELYTQLGDQLSDNNTVVVVCGNNRRLVRQLTAIPVKTHSRILGFTDQISTYMDAADCFVTKAGGISTTEALAKGTPTILLNAIGGCETYNYQFMTKNGLMLGAESANEAVKFILNEQYENGVSRYESWLNRTLIWETIQQVVQRIAVSQTASPQERSVCYDNTYDLTESGTLPAFPLV